jgi:hypothetical protein
MLTLNAYWSKLIAAKLVHSKTWGKLVQMSLLSATWQMQTQDSKAL